MSNLFRSFLQNSDSKHIGSSCSESFSTQRSGDVLLGLFFLYDSWWRWLVSRWIFLGPYFYLPYKLISSHGRKGRTNNHTNRRSSESWPFTISKLMCIQEILPDSHCLQMVGKCDHLPWKTDEKQELVKWPSFFLKQNISKIKKRCFKADSWLSLGRVTVLHWCSLYMRY